MIGNYNNLRKADVFRENPRQRPPAGRVGAVGGGVPDAPGTLLQPHTSRRHEGMPPYIPPYKQTVGRGALTPPRRGQGLSPQSRSKGGCDPLHFSCSFVKFLRQS